MASTIAAVTTSGGGVVTTADASGNLNLLAGTTTVVALTTAGAAVTGTLSATGTTKIGTTGTNGVLDLARTSDGAAITTFKTDGTSGIINSATSTTFQINTVEAMRIDSSGNVGIGTSLPAVKFSVSGFVLSGGQNYSARFSDAVNSTYSIGHQSGLVNLISDNAMAFYTSSAEAMRIDTNGRIQTGGLTVVDSARISVSFDGANSTGVSYKALAGSGGTVSTMVNSSGTGIGSITCTNTNVAFNTSSDYRLKNTIVPMTGALDKVALLKPVTYKWNVDGSDGQGFIAHELQEVVEGCVTGKKDGTKEEEYEVTPFVPAVVDAEGVETTPAVEAVKATRTVPSYQGVDTSFLVATLTAAIQELKAIIDTQATRIAALEAK